VLKIIQEIKNFPELYDPKFAVEDHEGQLPGCWKKFAESIELEMSGGYDETELTG
jgi:hypothetical protein